MERPTSPLEARLFLDECLGLTLSEIAQKLDKAESTCQGWITTHSSRYSFNNEDRLQLNYPPRKFDGPLERREKRGQHTLVPIPRVGPDYLLYGGNPRNRLEQRLVDKILNHKE